MMNESEIQEARKDLRSAALRMIEALDLDSGTHDDAAFLILEAEAIARTARELKRQADDRVLGWFLNNRAGHRDVVIGENRYYGSRDKRERVRDLPSAFTELARIKIGEAILAATYGDEENADQLLRFIGDLAASVVSTNGLKVGSCRAIIGDNVESYLKREDPEVDESTIRRRASKAFDTYWEVTYRDSLKGHPEARSLGVANMRFITRNVSDKRTRKDLLEMMRRAETARRRAFAAEANSPQGESPPPGSWSHALSDIENGDP